MAVGPCDEGVGVAYFAFNGSTPPVGPDPILLSTQDGILLKK